MYEKVSRSTVVALVSALLPLAVATVSLSSSSVATDKRCFVIAADSSSAFEIYQQGKYTSGQYMTLEVDFSFAEMATERSNTGIWDSV